MQNKDDLVICPECKNDAYGFINISYFDMYTVRCYHCNKEYDYDSKDDYKKVIMKESWKHEKN